MNIKFPNFNFDEWLKEYVIALLYADTKNIRPDIIESEKAAIDERKEFFYNQNHSITDDYWCLACEYSRMLFNFNEFMEIVSQKEIDLDLLDGHLSAQRNILKTTLRTNSTNLLKKLNIPYNDGKAETNL